MELASMRIIENFLKQLMSIIVTILPSSFDLRRVPNTIRIRYACFILSYLAACIYFCLILHGSFIVSTYFGSSCLRLCLTVPLAIIRSTVCLALAITCCSDISVGAKGIKMSASFWRRRRRD